MCAPHSDIAPCSTVRLDSAEIKRNAKRARLAWHEARTGLSDGINALAEM